MLRSLADLRSDIGSAARLSGAARHSPAGSVPPLRSESLELRAAGLPTMSFMPTFGGFQKGGAAKFGIASQMAARTPEPMPNDFVAASGATVFDMAYACPRRATRPLPPRGARPEGPSPHPDLPPALWQPPRRRRGPRSLTHVSFLQLLPEGSARRRHLLLHHARCAHAGRRRQDAHPAGPGQVQQRHAGRLPPDRG